MTTLTMSEIIPAYDFRTIVTGKQFRGCALLVADKLKQDGFTTESNTLIARAKGVPDKVGREELNALQLSLCHYVIRLGYVLCP